MSATTALDAPGAAPRAPETSGSVPAPRRRILGSLSLHAAALLLILLVIVGVVDNGEIANADEGATLSQAQLLESTGRWGTPYWAQEADPTGRWFPVEFSDRAGDLWFPYVKRPAYPALVATLRDVGGIRLVLGVHALGTALTAVAAALLARRLASSLAVPTLWVVGIGSPLLFDSYQVIAHSLAAAAATWGVVALCAWIIDRRRVAAVSVPIAFAVAALLRTDAMLFAIAVGLAACATYATSTRWRALSGAFATLAGATVGYLGASVWRGAVIGAGVVPFTTNSEGNWLTGRVHGAVASLLSPRIVGGAWPAAMSLVVAAAVVGVALLMRRRVPDVGLVVVVSVVAAAAAVLRVGLAPVPLPGLVIGAPVIVGGLVLARRWVWHHRYARFAASAATLHVLAVLATQYSVGGAGEWGGRFFHIALPLVIPLALAGWIGALGRVAPRQGRVVWTMLGVVSISLSILMVASQREGRLATAEITAAIDSGVAEVSATTARSPVVVSTNPTTGRFWWRHSLDTAMLATHDGDDLRAALETAIRSDRPVLLVAGASQEPTVDALAGHGWDVTRLATMPRVHGSTWLVRRS